MRRWILILGNAALLAVLLAVAVMAVRYTNETMQHPAPLIWYVPKSLDPSVEFWVAANQGAAAAAEEYGVRLVVKGTETEDDIEGQIAILREALEQKPDAVILAATDRGRLVPVAGELAAAGIRLVTVDSGLEGGASASFIGTDNYAAGQKAGEKMAGSVEGNGSVAIINTVPGSEAAWQRERGVRDTLKLSSRITVLETSYSGALARRAYGITRELLSKEPRLRGVVALNEPTAVGAAEAIRDMQAAGKVKLIGFDSSRDEVAFLENGLLQATVVQRPFNMGYLAVKTAREVIAGRRADAVVDTGSVVITRANMYVRENQKLLFPFMEGQP